MRNGKKKELIGLLFMFMAFVFVMIAYNLNSAHGFSKKLEAPKENIFEPVVVAPPFEFKAEWPDKTWTTYLDQALEKYGKEMLLMKQPADADKWCPKFESLSYEKRKQMFITMIVAMAKKESNWNPKTTYKESFNDSKGNPVISQGLLQISPESANQRAYGCRIDSSNKLLLPEVNLECGVKILNHWLPKDGVLGTAKLGGGRYWSVMRDSSSSQAYVRSKVMDVCKSL